MSLLERLKARLWPFEKSILRSVDGYIPAVNTARFLGEKRRILIVGDSGGRDWKYLSSLGKEVHGVDLSPQEGFPNLVVQSIEDRTPFPDQYFDGAVMNEVLEHLFRDADALGEVRRVLKDDGVLVITVPYFSNQQDSPEFHVRVHSPKTIRRLLEHTGFEIQEHFYRGFCSRLPQVNFFFGGLIQISQKMTQWATRDTTEASVHRVNRIFEKLERFLGSHAGTAWFQKLFTSYGGIMWAKKSPKKDFYEVQKACFRS